ncbi:hypothetical protein FB479_111121 [Brevibacillus sp. AG162]|jgi:hypothetical protein|nr:hypothetical protein FB479_111121 [Brevibacillus sp. AG162]
MFCLIMRIVLLVVKIIIQVVCKEKVATYKPATV